MRTVPCRLLKDEQGNIIIIGALAVFLIAAILALSIDFGRTTMKQSDSEIKLSALVAQAGEEFTYWQIRRTVSAEAVNMGLPAVQALPANQYVLHDATITESQALALLKTWVETEMRKTYPDVTIAAPVIRTNSLGQRILSFTGTQPQAKNFHSDTVQRQLNLSSAALINTIDDRTVASQVVYSLDKDSLDQLGSGSSATQAQNVFELVSRTIAGLSIPTSRITTGLTIGNVPMAAPRLTGGTGARITSEDIGVNIQSANLSYSGGLYDDQNTFTGTSIGTATRNFGGHRVYTVEAEFDATDAAQCANPVWVYRNRLGADCTRAYNWSEIIEDNSVQCTPPTPPTPPVGSPCIAGQTCDGVNSETLITNQPIEVRTPPPAVPPPPSPCSNPVCGALR